MDLGETLTVRTPAEWRRWLVKHHNDKKEIWVVYYKKASGKSGISYDESVEEALASVERPGRAVFVGDRPWDDVVGAGRAGMRTVLRRNPGVPAYDVEPDAVIDELLELIAVVDGWGRASAVSG